MADLGRFLRYIFVQITLISPCIAHIERNYRFPRLCVPLRPKALFRDVLQGPQGEAGRSKSDDCERITGSTIGNATAEPTASLKRITKSTR